LEAILSSPLFAPSKRLSRFLRWTVERTLEGGAGDLKEYSIGRDVFDRRESFDPKIDSIVRVEAQRLRKKLRQYYASHGANDAVVIEFPNKGYVPVFRTAGGAPEAYGELDSRTVAVLPFRSLTPGADGDFLCEGIAEEILGELANRPELKVLAWPSMLGFRETNLDIREIGLRLGAGTLLDGCVRRAGERVRASVGALDARSGKYIWTHRFDREIKDVLQVQVEIAQAVAARLGGAPLLPANTGLPAAPRPDAYMQYLQGRHEWNQFTIPSVHAAIGHYLEAIALSPDFAQPYGAVAICYLVQLLLGAARPAEAGALAGGQLPRRSNSIHIAPTLTSLWAPSAVVSIGIGSRASACYSGPCRFEPATSLRWRIWRSTTPPGAIWAPLSKS